MGKWCIKPIFFMKPWSDICITVSVKVHALSSTTQVADRPTTIFDHTTTFDCFERRSLQYAIYNIQRSLYIVASQTCPFSKSVSLYCMYSLFAGRAGCAPPRARHRDPVLHWRCRTVGGPQPQTFEPRARFACRTMGHGAGGLWRRR